MAFKRPNFKIPEKKSHRLVLGWALIVGGIFGFMPIAGIWMLPLGLLVLLVDSPRIRRWRRQLVVWWYRRRARESALAV